MYFDLEHLDASLTYKLLAATVMPRPIAWVVTEGDAGLNAAPYSFFNVMGAAPPTVALGLLADPQKGFKDTARNIQQTGEFVINLVPERMASDMNTTAVNAPAEINELHLAGLATQASSHIAPPRIADSPVAFECRSLSLVETGPFQCVVIGQVLAIHIDEAYVLDRDRCYIDTPGLDLVGRSYGNEYVKTRDRFLLERPIWEASAKASGTERGSGQEA